MGHAHARPIDVVGTHDRKWKSRMPTERFAVDLRQHVGGTRPRKIGKPEGRRLRGRDWQAEMLKRARIDFAGRSEHEPPQSPLPRRQLKNGEQHSLIVTQDRERAPFNVRHSDNRSQMKNDGVLVRKAVDSPGQKISRDHPDARTGLHRLQVGVPTTP